MKITNNENHQEQRPQQSIDLIQLINDLQAEHRNVFCDKIEDQVFIYRMLKRSEYKRLTQENISDLEKEEVVCQACTLWPEDYDFENCDAGTPSKLCKLILYNSFLDSIETRKAVLSAYRDEMEELDNQINCIINEAFPQFDIEEIEQWDIAQTAKYLSRAEWKLQNLRGLVMQYDPMENAQQAPQQQQAPQPKQQPTRKEEPPKKNKAAEVQEPGKVETIAERQDRLKKEGMKKEKLTPEKLAELKAKFPEINWEADEVALKGVDAMKDNIDSASPALRPGW